MNKKTQASDVEKVDTTNIKQIGEIFKTKRTEMGLTYVDIYNALKIRSNIVDDIENSSWEYLEKHIHLANFAKQYAKFLNITDTEIIEKINTYTRVNHSIQDFSPIDTFKNTGKELNNLSDSGNNTFSMKKKSSNTSKSIVITVVIVILVALIGGIFAYKQGLFSSTKSLVKDYKKPATSQDKNNKSTKNKNESDGNNSSNGFGQEKIKIVKLTTDGKTKTILEETPPENNSSENQSSQTANDSTKVNVEENIPETTATAGNISLNLVAMKDVWIYVKDKKTDTILTSKILKKDTTLQIPTGDNLYLSVSSPYNVKGSFGTKTFQHLGTRNKVLNLLRISENNLKTLFR